MAELGPLERKIALILNESIRDTPFGLTVRVQGPEAAGQTFKSLSQEQLAEFVLKAYTGHASALRQLAREIDKANLVPPDNHED